MQIILPILTSKQIRSALVSAKRTLRSFLRTLRIYHRSPICSFVAPDFFPIDVIVGVVVFNANMHR